MHLRRLNSKRVRRQRGFTLVESLVALLVLALGILGLAGVQARMLVENRIANQRAIAIGLIDSLAQSMTANPSAARDGKFSLDWGPNSAFVECAKVTCSPDDFAKGTLNLWRTRFVQGALPNVDAKVFRSSSDPQQIGIAIAWQANEGAAASDSKYTAQFNVNLTNPDVKCPVNKICQLVYVRP